MWYSAYLAADVPLADYEASTMDISSFNVDVLLHLIDFIDPFDRLNFFFSGIPERFENVKEGLDLQERYS